MQQENTDMNAVSGNNAMRRRVNDLVVAEMFLIQATLESATVIGDGVSKLGRQITQGNDEGDESVQEILERIKDEALEPYTSRYQYLKQLMGGKKN
jgi:hypothetical protein